MNSIGIFSYGRKGSQRCPNKMLRHFSETTLTEIIVKKLKILGDNTFYAGYDEEFREKTIQAGVKFIQRTKNSASVDEPQIECLSFLQDVDYEYLLLINGCVPFLTTETILFFLNDVIKNDLQPSVIASKKHNYYFDEKKCPINFSTSIKALNTKTVTPLYEFGNALYFFNREQFFKKGMFWDWNQLRLVDIGTKLELIDIDTEEDFDFAERIWTANKV